MPISLRYLAVELLTAVLFVSCYASFGLTWLLLKSCVFCFLIVGLIFMDAETGLLPHEFTYSGIGLGLGFAWIAPIDSSGTAFLFRAFGLHDLPPGPQLSVLDSVVAAVFGAGFFYMTWALYYLVRRRQGMGFGDIALIAMVGAFLGLKLSLLVIFFAPMMAILFALAMFLMGSGAGTGRRTPDHKHSTSVAKEFLSREIPFGIFLGATSLIALFLGGQFWGWYFGLFR